MLSEILSSINSGLLACEKANNNIVIKPQELIAWCRDENNRFFFDLLDACEKHRRILEVYSNVFLIEQLIYENQKSPYGFYWLRDENSLKKLYEELQSNKFIESVSYGLFHEAFCFGKYHMRLTWTKTIEILATLIYGLRDAKLIKNYKIPKNAALTFDIRTLDGKLATFNSATFSSSSPNSSKIMTHSKDHDKIHKVIGKLEEQK